MSEENPNDKSPAVYPCGPECCSAPVNHGLSLRDHFAAKALVGILSADRDYARCRQNLDLAKIEMTRYVAEVAYELADAMLEARHSQ